MSLSSVGKSSSSREETPKLIQAEVEPKPDVENEAPWSTGSHVEEMNAKSEASHSDTCISIEAENHPSMSTKTVHDSDKKTAHAAAEKMGQRTEQPVETPPAKSKQRRSAMSCQPTIANCCTATSVAMLCLSVASFVIPSLSSDSENRITTQALAYTAGIITLLISVATGACVVSLHTKTGDFRR